MKKREYSLGDDIVAGGKIGGTLGGGLGALSGGIGSFLMTDPDVSGLGALGAKYPTLAKYLLKAGAGGLGALIQGGLGAANGAVTGGTLGAIAHPFLGSER